jgi:CDP-glycerol glycerophosphotransferase
MTTTARSGPLYTARGAEAVSFRPMPAISLIITVHDAAEYLDRCLDSVLSQETPGAEAEIIVIDDASGDRSREILAARDDPRLTVIRTETTLGPGGARELGVKEATGDYLWFVDGDDELADGALAAAAAQLDRLHPDMLNVNYENVYAGGVVTPSGTDLSVPELTTISESPVLLNVTMSMWNKVFRREFLSGLGVPFGPGLYEAVPVATMALLTAPRIGVLDRVCYRYRRSRPGSFMGTISARHFDIFTSYEAIFDAAAAHPLTPAVRTTLFTRAIRHYVFALPKVPRSRRRDFFNRMARDFQRWKPAGYTFLPGFRGIELRLIDRGAYRTYAALIPLNELRLAPRRRRAQLRK